jgi:glycosyltransferase involved in cell wall biosynthesis
MTAEAIAPLRIVVVTDAWFPQVNGVVRTLRTVGDQVERMGHSIKFITPDMFRTIPCPTYPEIRLCINAGGRLARMLEAEAPDAVHISTEGPLGIAARRWCLRHDFPFTTAFHTRFPDYVHARLRIPVSWSWAVLKWFHRPSKGVMVATRTLETELNERGLANTKIWTRGVDLELFRPVASDLFANMAKPVFLFVGRVAIEKNIEAFLKLDLPGIKVVVGDGPQRRQLQAAFPKTVFAGEQHGEALAAHFSAADVFVFPSLTDTFGLVMLEAMACGLPVAAFPVAGPVDVVTDHRAGVLDADLGKAARQALKLSGDDARRHAIGYSWENCANIFLSNLHPVQSGPHCKEPGNPAHRQRFPICGMLFFSGEECRYSFWSSPAG